MNKHFLGLAAIAALALLPTFASAQNKGVRPGGAKAAAPRPAVAAKPAIGAAAGVRPAVSQLNFVRPAVGGIGFSTASPATGFSLVNSGPVYGNFSNVNSGGVFGNFSNVNSGLVFGGLPFVNPSNVTNVVVNPAPVVVTGTVFGVGAATTPVQNAGFSMLQSGGVSGASPLRWGGGVVFGPGFDPNGGNGFSTGNGTGNGHHSYYPASNSLDKQGAMPGVDIAHLKKSSARAAAAVQIHLPNPDAELWFNGVKMQQSGQTRQFVTPDLAPGQTYTYEVRAKWREKGQDIDLTRMVTVESGGQVVHSFVPGGKEVLPVPVEKR